MSCRVPTDAIRTTRGPTPIGAAETSAAPGDTVQVGKFKFIASQSIKAGEPVAVNDDGMVEPVAHRVVT